MKDWSVTQMLGDIFLEFVSKTLSSFFLSFFILPLFFTEQNLHTNKQTKADFLRCYSLYINNYSTALQTLSACATKNAAFAQFLQRLALLFVVFVFVVVVLSSLGGVHVK